MRFFFLFLMQILPLIIAIAIVAYMVVALRRLGDAVEDIRADLRRLVDARREHLAAPRR